jgi:hypothetical protein
MTSSDKNEVAADFSDLLTELSGPQAIQHRARTAVREALEILEALPPPPT